LAQIDGDEVGTPDPAVVKKEGCEVGARYTLALGSQYEYAVEALSVELTLLVYEGLVVQTKLPMFEAPIQHTPMPAPLGLVTGPGGVRHTGVPQTLHAPAVLTLVVASVPVVHCEEPAVPPPEEQQHSAEGDVPQTLALGRQYVFWHIDPARVVSAEVRMSTRRPLSAALEGMVPQRLFCATQLWWVSPFAVAGEAGNERKSARGVVIAASGPCEARPRVALVRDERGVGDGGEEE
jgi:hypothetical protein